MTDVNLEEYFEKTYKEKLPVKPIDKKNDVAVPSMEVVNQRKKLIATEEALLNRRKEFENKMLDFEDQKKSIEDKQSKLKEYLSKFDKFLKENKAKQTRAEKRAIDQAEVWKMKEKEMESLGLEISQLLEQKQIYQEKLDENSLYLKSLERIVEYSEEFPEIKDIISRYDTLVLTQLDLLERERVIQDAIEAEKMKISESVTVKDNEILHFNNLLASLQSKLDDAKSELTRWENKWVRIQNTATEKTLALGKTKIAIHNIYQLVAKNSKYLCDAEPDDIQLQLEKIQTFLLDLVFIVGELKKNSETSL